MILLKKDYQELQPFGTSIIINTGEKYLQDITLSSWALNR